MRRFAWLLLVLALWACSPASEDLMLQQAEQEYASGNFLRAESLYERYLEANPQGDGRWDAWERLVDISLNIVGDQRKGSALLESAYLEYADNPERAAGILWRLAQVYTDQRHWDQALETWLKLIDLRGASQDRLWEVHWNLGKIYQFQGQYAMAKDSMLSCMELAPDDNSRSRCMYELAQAFSFLKDKEQARNWLEKLLALKDADPELRALSAYLLAELAEADGDIEKARALLESIRDSYPNPKVIDARLQHLK